MNNYNAYLIIYELKLYTHLRLIGRDVGVADWLLVRDVIVLLGDVILGEELGQGRVEVGVLAQHLHPPDHRGGVHAAGGEGRER